MLEQLTSGIHLALHLITVSPPARVCLNPPLQADPVRAAHGVVDRRYIRAGHRPLVPDLTSVHASPHLQLHRLAFLHVDRGLCAHVILISTLAQ